MSGKGRVVRVVLGDFFSVSAYVGSEEPQRPKGLLFISERLWFNRARSKWRRIIRPTVGNWDLPSTPWGVRFYPSSLKGWFRV